MKRLPRIPLPRPAALVLFLAWWGALFALSSMSPPDLPEMPVTINDKAAHAVFFFAGAFLFAAALRPGPGTASGTRAVWITAVCLAAIGAADELYQKLTPGRTGADPFDWLADCAGALAGAWFAKWYFQPAPPEAAREDVSENPAPAP